MKTKDKYKEKAKAARLKVLEMIHKAGTSHIASNFSVIDIATVLYENLKEGDEVVWSKGWAAATIYYFLAQQGKIQKEDLEKFPQHPYLGLAETSVNGVLCNAGAVGHGTPIATGIALGKKRANKQGTVYCIMSDGELNEGTVWESAQLAVHHKLNNLVFIVDVNKIQAMGFTKDIVNLEPIEDRWRGFGWQVSRIDGHSTQQLHLAIRLETRVPHVILCDTIKGKGVSFFEGLLLYHYKHVDALTYEKAKAELV